MRSLIRRTRSVWQREEGFTVLLAVLVGALFVAPLLKDAFPVLAAVSTALSILVFVVGALVVARNAWGAVAVSLLTGTAIALEMVQKIDGADPFAPWRLGAASLTIGLFAAVTLVRVFSPGPVTGHRLTGAVVAYLLVGLTWAFVYELLEALRRGSFHGAQGVAQRRPAAAGGGVALEVGRLGEAAAQQRDQNERHEPHRADDRRHVEHGR